MAYIPKSDSVVAFQSQPSSMLVGASIIGVIPTQQQGTVISSIAGIPNVNIASIAGTGVQLLDDNTNNVNPSSVVNKLPVIGRNTLWFNANATWERQRQIENAQNAASTGITAAGLVAQFDDTTPSGVTENNFAPLRMSSVRGLYTTIRDSAGNERGVNVDVANAMQVNTGGSVVAFQGGNQITSIVNTVPSSVIVGASIFGQLPGGTATIGSVVVIQGTNPHVFTGSIQGTVSVLGTVPVTQSGGWSNSIVSANPSSVQVGASIFGQLPAGTALLGSIVAIQGTSPWNIAGSVAAAQIGTQITSLVSTIPSSVIVGSSIFGQLPAGTAVIGSVAVLQGTNPFVITGSIQGNIGGSVVAFISANSSSIYGMRNDALTSFLGADQTERPIVTDSAGRIIIKQFAGEQACIISYTGSVVSGSVTLMQASVIGSRSYITDFWVVNTGSIANLITFQGGDTSVIGYTIAPGGGGSNSPGIAIPLRTTLSQDLAFKVTPNGTISSVIYVTVKGYQAP